MTTLRFRLTLPALLVASTLAFGAHAFTENQDIRPVKVLGFTGAPALGGSFPGVRPFAPPVLLPGTGQLLGLTQDGGATWVGSFQQETEGATLYTLNVDGSGYASQPLDSRFGKQNTLLTLDPATGSVYVGGESALDGNGTLAGVVYAIRGGQPQVLASTAEGVTGALQVRGQWGLDPAGYLYMGSTIGSASCRTDALKENNNQLHRIHPELQSELQRVARLCDFSKEQVVLTRRANGNLNAPVYRYAQHRGALPRLLLWSDSDKAMYVMASNSGAVTDMPGVPSVDQNGRPSATLFRLTGTDLDRLPLSASAPPAGQVFDPADAAAFEAYSNSDVYQQYVRDDGFIDNAQLLRHMGVASEGIPRSALDYSNVLVEAGDWIYGTSYSNVSSPVQALGGVLWRVHKTRGASSFEVVHRFSDASWEGAVDGDGSNPAGPMVLALDGNLYGTTVADVRALNERGTIALGDGVLFRITAPTSDNPVYEPLAYFDGTSLGARPVGLTSGSLVTLADGKRVHQLWGAARFGGEADYAPDGNAHDGASGHGTLFRIDVPVADIVLRSFTASATVSRPNTRPTLQWVSSGTQACTASGDWEGEFAPSGSYRLPELSALRTYTYALQCTGYSGQTETRTVSIQVIDGEGSVDTSRGGGALGGALALLLALGAVARLRRR